AAPDRQLGEADTLLVLGEVADIEALEQRPQVCLYGVDAQEDLLGDLLVRCRGGELASLTKRPAEGNQNAPLGVGDGRRLEAISRGHRLFRTGLAGGPK